MKLRGKREIGNVVALDGVQQTGEELHATPRGAGEVLEEKRTRVGGVGAPELLEENGENQLDLGIAKFGDGTFLVA